MRVIYILHGISGSGKSTWTKRFMRHLPKAYKAAVVSADDYFMTPNGVYAFNPSKLGAAHRTCKQNAANFMLHKHERAVLIVDNTNTSHWEFEPYEKLAHTNGWQIRHKFFVVDLGTAIRRNQHGVPCDTIKKQLSRLAQLKEEMKNEA